MGIVNPPISGGSSTLNVASTTSAYTITSANDVLLVSGGAFTVTLPDATTATKKVYRIKKTDASLTNIITLATVSSQTIDGAAASTCTLNTQNEEYDIFPDGSNWWIADHKCNTPWTTYALTLTSSVSGNPVRGSGYTESARWRRVSDTMEVEYAYTHSTAGTNGTSGTYLYSVPSGLTISSTKTILPTTAATASVNPYGGDILGNGIIATTSTANTAYYEPITVTAFTGGTNFVLNIQNAQSTTIPWGSGSTPNYAGAALYIGFNAAVAISGWHE